MALFDTAWAQLGAVGFLGLFVLALLTGRLMARSVARELVQQANTNAERWRAAAEASDKRADESVRLMGEMTQAMRAVETLIRSQRGTS